MVDGQRREDEVERAVRERLLDPLHEQLCVLEPRLVQHLRALVDADQVRGGMDDAHRPRGDAGTGPELEHLLDREPIRRGRNLSLQLVEAGDPPHHLVVTRRLEMELAHAKRSRSFGSTSAQNCSRKRRWSSPGAWKTRWSKPRPTYQPIFSTTSSGSFE